MKKSLLLSIFSFSILISSSQEKSCTKIILPQLSETVKKDFQQKLFEAKVIYEKDSSNADAIIWYGRRTAYLGDYMKAIEIFSKGINIHPGDARMYRHRGHRYITVRCFDKAIIDFKKAARLIKGKPDETEPDGLPNAKNIPTSTLQSNIWYHLGLAYFLNSDYKKAVNAYRKCLVVSNNPDMYVATANWMYITLLKIKRTKDAEKHLLTINANEELLESEDYLKILLLYRQQTDMNDPVMEIDNNTTLSSASYGFGLGNYLLERGKKEQAKNVFQKVVSGNQWSSFGFIAAEKALAEFK